MTEPHVSPDIAATLYANSGAFMSRTRRERVRSSLLGKDDGHVLCTRRIRLGLWFEATDPVAYVESLMARAGLRDVDELRQAFPLPDTPLICCAQLDPVEQLNAFESEPLDVLEQALWLGLCTGHVFDPARPVIWTHASLRRKLDLFEPGGYYA